jgi:hypothetical protein
VLIFDCCFLLIRLQPGLFARSSIELCVADGVRSFTQTDSGAPLLERTLAHVAEATRNFIATQQQRFDRQVCRVVLAGLDRIVFNAVAQTGEAVNPRVVARFLLRLKHIVQKSRVSVLVTLNTAAVSTETAVRLRQVADTVLSVESFAGRAHSVPYEFKEFQGFLVVQKLQHYGSMAPFRPPGTRFGLKRDRRKLHIEPLHLPPEESRAFSTTGGAEQTHTSGAATAGPTTAWGAVPGASGVSTTVGIAHDHEHVHTEHCQHPPPSGVKAEPAPMEAAGSATFKTPLQASLAALKAARQASQAAAASSPGGSSGPEGLTGTAAHAPVSINRSFAPVPNIAGTVGAPSPAPLRPGEACGAQAAAKSGNSALDF